MDTGWMLILHYLYEGAKPMWIVAFVGGLRATFLYICGGYTQLKTPPPDLCFSGLFPHETPSLECSLAPFFMGPPFSGASFLLCMTLIQTGNECFLLLQGCEWRLPPCPPVPLSS